MLFSSTMAHKLVMTFLDMVRCKHIITLMDTTHTDLDTTTQVTSRAIPVGSMDMVIQDNRTKTQLEIIRIRVCMLVAVPMDIMDAMLSNLTKVVDHMAYQIVVSHILVQE